MNAEALFFGALLFSATSRPSDLAKLTRAHLDEAWQGVFDFCLTHVQEQGRLPHPSTVEMQCKTVLGPAPEHISFYADRVRENAMRRVMEEGFITEVATPLNNVQSAKALEGAKKVIAQVQREFVRAPSASLVYGSNTGTRWADYDIRARGGGHGLALPYPTITAATRGLLPGEVWVIAARPNQGKTMCAIHLGVSFMKQGYRVLFGSMETPPQSARPRDLRHRVVRGACTRCCIDGVSAADECPAALIERQRLTIRFDALGAGVSPWRLLQGKLTPREKDTFQAYLATLANPRAAGLEWGEIKIVSPPDVKTLTDMELAIAEFQPDVVIWDSAYLAADRDGRNRKDDYDDLLIAFKSMCEREGLPGVLTWHFSREVNEKATYASMNDTAYTDELCRLTDVIIGLFRPPDLQTAREAILRTLKVRDGVAVPELRTAWDMTNEPRFQEIRAVEDGQPDERKGKR